MSSLVEKVIQKLDEYDITIFDHYEIENNEHTFIVEDMLIIIHENMRISVSFQVSTKPEIVANDILILNEIKEIKHISIMESFAFTSEKKMVSGKQAYDLFKKTMKSDIIQDFTTSNYHKMILMNTKGHEC
jgi:hypothetical protein